MGRNSRPHWLAPPWHPASRLAPTAKRMAAMLPGHDITAALVTVMAHLELGADILACHLLEAESALSPCFHGAALPPRMFALYMSEQLEVQARSRQGQRPRHRHSGPQSSSSSSSSSKEGSSSSSRSSSSSSSSSKKEGSSRRGSGAGGVGGQGSVLAEGMADTEGLYSETGGVEDGQESEDGAAEGASDPSHQPLDLVQILARLQGLAGVLGPEVAYSGVSRAPRVLLAAPTEQARACHAALMGVLNVGDAQAARMIEARGKLITQEPQVLQAQLSALTIALGWPKSRVRKLCLEEPLCLLRPPSDTGRLWRRLQRAARLQQPWLDTLSQAPVPCLAVLLRLPAPDEALARAEFLAGEQQGGWGQGGRDLGVQQGGRGQWGRGHRGVRGRPALEPLERVLRTPLGAFMREHPAYRQWQSRGGGGGAGRAWTEVAS